MGIAVSVGVGTIVGVSLGMDVGVIMKVGVKVGASFVVGAQAEISKAKRRIKILRGISCFLHEIKLA